MNTVCLVGRLTRDPRTTFEGDGLQICGLTLAIAEPGKEGRVFTLYVACVAYGKTADACSLLEAEALVAVSGKLSWRKQTGTCGREHSQLVVQIREVQVLQPAEVAA